MATTEDGAFLISPRAAVQAHLDDLVSRGGFVECPVQADPVMGGRGVGFQRSARGPDSGDARGTAEHDCSVGSRGAGSGDSARGPISGDACETAALDCLVTSRGKGGGESARGPNCEDARDDAEDGSGARGVPSDGGNRGGSSTAGHKEARPPVQLCFGMDKRGRTSSVKVFLGIANQSRSAGAGNSVVLGVFPCGTDDFAALQRICAMWLADVEDLRSNGLSVAGELRTVRLILTGDIAWMTAFCGHAGSSSRHRFLICTALGPRWWHCTAACSSVANAMARLAQWSCRWMCAVLWGPALRTRTYRSRWRTTSIGQSNADR